MLVAVSLIIPIDNDYRYIDYKAPLSATHYDGFSELNDVLRKSEFPQNDYDAVNYDNPVGVWISYIELDGMLRNSTEDSFRSSINEAFSNIKNLGANTVYVHVRAFGDAYYPSLYFPWTSAFGESEPFDALEIMIEEAHSLELSFHAWINPLRCSNNENIGGQELNHRLFELYDNIGEKIVKPGDNPYMWLNPAYGDVRNLVSAGCAEIASRYDVDGIHIDDYFYPTTDESFDAAAFKESGQDSLSGWRMNNISKLVMMMNIEIKKANPSVVFEISPQGNVNNNYVQMFADVGKWCESKLYCDIIIPQVYFGYSSRSPYLTTIEEWSNMVSENGPQLVIGLGVYKIAEETEFRNTENIIASQINDAYKLQNVCAVAFYNYRTLFDDGELMDRMQSERGAISEILK